MQTYMYKKSAKYIVTRAGQRESLTATYKSAITNHVVDKNCTIDCGGG